LFFRVAMTAHLPPQPLCPQVQWLEIFASLHASLQYFSFWGTLQVHPSC
jgi:hypothetical protein